MVMSGLSGSGKSTTAQQLIASSHAIRLRSDAVRKHLAGISIHDRGSNDIYTPEMTDRTYSTLVELGVMLAKRGDRIILDAKFDRQAKRAEALDAAKAARIPLTFVYCTAPADVLKARVEQRSGDIADATAAILARQTMDPFQDTDPVITLDTTSSAEVLWAQLAGVFSFLE